MSKYLYHNHHIIPKHMGGTDEPENLVRLTIEEHAEAHRRLYEEHGKQEDYIAWKMLCGQMKMPEMKRRLQLLGASNRGKKGGKIAGPKAKREKLGWHGMTTKQRKENGLKTVSMKVGIHAEGYDKGIGGKKGGDKCRDEKLGIHALSTQERSNVGKKGGASAMKQKKGIHGLSTEERSQHGKKCVVEKKGIHGYNKDERAAINKGRIKIYKGNEEKAVKENELTHYISDGWKLGRIGTPCVIHGKMFDKMEDAAEYYGLNVTTVRRRCNKTTDKWKDWAKA